MRQRLWDIFGTALLALVLAVVVWVNATYVEDAPYEEWFKFSIPIEVLNAPSNLTLTNNPDTSVEVKINAFGSSWDKLTINSFRATVDWQGLAEGLHNLPIEVTCSDRTVEIVATRPDKMFVQLERFTTDAIEVEPLLTDSQDVPLGYVVGLAEVEPRMVKVLGPTSTITRIVKLVAETSLSGQRARFERVVKPYPVDESGQKIDTSVLTIEPDTVVVSCDIQKKSNYREVVIRAQTVGHPARGYFVSSVDVISPTITVVGPPATIAEMGGTVDVLGELDLTDATRDLEEAFPLDLPDGVSVLGAPSGDGAFTVVVRVGIDAVTGGTTVEVPLKPKKLREGLLVDLSVPTVDVILTGPSVLLDELDTSLIDAYVDLTGLNPASHQVKIHVNLLVDKAPELAALKVTNISPEFIQVDVKEPPTATPTTFWTATPTATLAPTVPLTATRSLTVTGTISTPLAVTTTVPITGTMAPGNTRTPVPAAGG